jgi:hypothetical protein
LKYLPQELLTAGFVVVLALNWPGQMSYDSVMQLADGRSGQYDSWHPPVMAWLLGLFDHLLPGPGLFLAFMVVLLWGAWLILLRIGRPGFGAGLVLIAIFLTPQLLLYQGTIWKDVLFADAGVGAFATLAAAAACWKNARTRLVWLTLSVALSALAILTRQNGFLLVPIAALALGVIAARSASRRTGWCYGLGFLAASVMLSSLGSFALSFHGDDGDGADAQLRLAQTYDLVGAARLDPTVRFAVLEQKAPALDSAIRKDGVPLYSPHLVDTLETSPALIAEIGRAPRRVIFAQWLNLVSAHPGLYLRDRAPVFRWVLAPPDLLLCHPDMVGVDGPKEVLHALGLAPRMTARDRFLYFYVARFTGTPVLSHLLFAALALVSMVLLLRRGQGSDIAVAGLAAAGLVFSVSFFVISIACDYRYLYFLDLAAMTCALKLASGGDGISPQSQ